MVPGTNLLIGFVQIVDTNKQNEKSLLTKP